MTENIHRVLAPKELNSFTVSAFRDEIRDSLDPGASILDVDLGETVFVDSSGLGGLISLNKKMAMQGGIVRLINPASSVQQLLELTRMHRIFEIIHA